jgi:DNA-binding winged helix-turn-helix (wHTH) protein/Tol biopolymer transport system component
MFPASSGRYRFGAWILDAHRISLSCGGRNVPLRPKTFDVLSFLVQHPGRLVPKSELMDAVWPDAFVTESSLVQCLVEIRKALGDDAALIATIPRRGYRFDGHVIPLPADDSPIESADREMRPWPAPLRGRVWAATRRHPVLAVLLLGLIGVGVATGARTLGVIAVSDRPVTSPSAYVQLTDFTDSAAAPAVSPDGRLVAFIRGGGWFLSRGQIYVKPLPDGEPRQLTDDGDMKLAPVFTPDGSRVAYTRATKSGWDTWTVPVAGGKPARLLTNASGLIWLARSQVMYSEARPPSPHMGIVTSTESRSERREIYFPAHQRSMAHYSYASPDRQWVVIIEMDPTGAFDRCRLVPFSGGAGRAVGPQGRCTAAAWSPKGDWMYFSAEVGGRSHIWRQAFPDGSPEQITFGPTDEEGVAVAPDGRSLITSVGRPRSAIWFHDDAGDRPLSTEGFAFAPRLSPDGRRVYFLLRHAADSSTAELRSIDLASGSEERLLTGLGEPHDAGGVRYDISPDGQEVVYALQDAEGRWGIWLARPDRRAPPRLLAPNADFPSFGPDGDVFFIDLGDTTSHLVRMRTDGGGRTRITRNGPVVNRGAVSPDGKWVVVFAAEAVGESARTVAVSLDGGESRRLCNALCWAWWSPDGSFLYVQPYGPEARTLVVPNSTNEPLPNLGDAAFDDAELPAIQGMQVIDSGTAVPAWDSSRYVFVQIDEVRNLYRVPLH